MNNIVVAFSEYLKFMKGTILIADFHVIDWKFRPTHFLGITLGPTEQTLQANWSDEFNKKWPYDPRIYQRIAKNPLIYKGLDSKQKCY